MDASPGLGLSAAARVHRVSRASTMPAIDAGVRPRAPRRRHHARAQLADHLLRDLAVLVETRGVETRERQARPPSRARCDRSHSSAPTSSFCDLADKAAGACDTIGVEAGAVGGAGACCVRAVALNPPMAVTRVSERSVSYPSPICQQPVGRAQPPRVDESTHVRRTLTANLRGSSHSVNNSACG